jgi:hypothetical protein
VKTNVYIHLNGNSFIYVFNNPIDVFLQKWISQISSNGYFSDYDEKGKFITVNPSCCGVVVIGNKTQNKMDVN